MDARIVEWLKLVSGGEAPNLYVVGGDKSTREDAVVDVLAELPPLFDFARMAFGEVAAALGREQRLLSSLSSDPWSDERSSRARHAPLLVIDDFGAGEPDANELFGLMTLFQIRRDNARPIIASSQLLPSEVVHIWQMSKVDEVLADKTDWRFFRNSTIVEI